MAYVSKETKAKIATALKAAKLPATLKYTLAVRHHTELVVTIRQAPAVALDDYIADQNALSMDEANARARRAAFEAGEAQVNEFHMERQFEGQTLKMLQTIMTTIKTAGEWFDKSDSQTDYFHTAFYITLQFGGNTPCKFVGKRRKAKPAEAVVETPVEAPVAEPAPEPVADNVIAVSFRRERSDAELTEIARAEMVRRFIAAMRNTVVGGAFSDQALDVLATAAAAVVMTEAK